VKLVEAQMTTRHRISEDFYELAIIRCFLPTKGFGAILTSLFSMTAT
jgi:hypothetical protein